MPGSNIFYNYFRDYDPQTGRYLEPDPIGLSGGSYSTYAYTGGNPISDSDPSGLLVQGEGWNAKEWQRIENAATKIRKELEKGCTCGSNGCVPCDLIAPLLVALDTMIVSYAPLGGDCGHPQPSDHPRGLFLSRVPLGEVPHLTCKPGCLASTLYHELLHTTGQVFDVPTASRPAAGVLEQDCIGHLCKGGSR